MLSDFIGKRIFAHLFWLPSRSALAMWGKWGLRALFQDFLHGKDNVIRKSLRLQRFARYLFRRICGLFTLTP
jgi:hypothetical protein